MWVRHHKQEHAQPWELLQRNMLPEGLERVSMVQNMTQRLTASDIAAAQVLSYGSQQLRW